mgnify:CR=1 FL=1
MSLKIEVGDIVNIDLWDNEEKKDIIFEKNEETGICTSTDLVNLNKHLARVIEKDIPIHAFTTIDYYYCFNNNINPCFYLADKDLNYKFGEDGKCFNTEEVFTYFDGTNTIKLFHLGIVEGCKLSINNLIIPCNLLNTSKKETNLKSLYAAYILGTYVGDRDINFIPEESRQKAINEAIEQSNEIIDRKIEIINASINNNSFVQKENDLMKDILSKL